MRETRVRSLGWEDPLEKEMAIHSNTIAWKIPWSEEPGRLQSMGSQRVGHNWPTSLSLSFPTDSTKSDKKKPEGIFNILLENLNEIPISLGMYAYMLSPFSHVWLFATPWTVAHQVLCPWDSPGKNTGVGCHFLLQGIFPTQRSNPGLPHCRWTPYHLSHQGSPGKERDKLKKGMPIKKSWGLLGLKFPSLSNGEGNGTPLSTLAWKTPWTEKPDRLQSMGSQRVGHYWATSLSLSHKDESIISNFKKCFSH